MTFSQFSWKSIPSFCEHFSCVLSCSYFHSRNSEAMIEIAKPWFIVMLTPSHSLAKRKTTIFMNILVEAPPFPLLLTHPLVEIQCLGGPTFSCDFHKGNSWILASVNATQEVIYQMTVKMLLFCYYILIMYLCSKENNICKFWHFNSPETVQKSGYNKVWKTIWLSANVFGKPAHAYFTLFLLIWSTRKQIKVMSCWTKYHI